MEIMMREEILKVSRLHFEAHIEKHRINVENLLRNSQGVADHPDIMETIEKEMEIMSTYHDLIEVLDNYFSTKGSKELINERT